MWRLRTFMLMAAMAVCLNAGDTSAADKPEYSGFLDDYSQLQSRPDSKMIYNYVYEKPGADFSQYNQFLIEAVTVFPSRKADFKGINANDLTLLQQYFRDAVAKALTENSGYQVVEEPGPGVVLIRVAFTDLVPVNPAMNTVTTIIPQMRLTSGIIGAATGSNLFVGQLGIEAEFLDAHSNERIAAQAGKQAGKKYVPFTGKKFEPASTWGQVQQEMDYWARKLRQRIDQLHGKTTAAAEQ
ncbi:MAG: DUF3313 domain-containing protein [Candidatus Binatia bacterium]